MTDIFSSIEIGGMKLAKLYTGRKGFIAMLKAFHG